ncbi:hypothetical protein NQ317_002769 [Molorchus minor]|uniref:Uncharacterized protein n=1 Tax=Molorchus minor TaxID=1323400 RepID=A0ABQ9IYK8_9CUCU|nr:hypothetical protein NQ317_002769 [Molorchus minor]
MVIFYNIGEKKVTCSKAPDDKYLMFNVVAVMGILGACRREEFCQMSLNNIEDLGNTLVVARLEFQESLLLLLRHIDLYRKYLALRPAHVNHQRLFVKYTNIAGFLKLPNSEVYTENSFCRTSASLLADSGWNSSSVAEGYVEDSLENKKWIACHILPNNCPSSNISEIEHINSISSTASSSTLTISSCEVASSQGINITNCSNCTTTINISK